MDFIDIVTLRLDSIAMPFLYFSSSSFVYIFKIATIFSCFNGEKALLAICVCILLAVEYTLPAYVKLMTQSFHYVSSSNSGHICFSFVFHVCSHQCQHRVYFGVSVYRCCVFFTFSLFVCVYHSDFNQIWI